MCIIYLGVSISMEQSVYSLTEADGFVEVCADLQGQLARDVEIELKTKENTASEFIGRCMKFLPLTKFEYTILLSLCVQNISLWTGLWKFIDHAFILWSNQ